MGDTLRGIVGGIAMSTSSSVAALQSLQPGSRFGSYDVVRCIGMGGMGAVFEATHRLLDRRVALKVMLGDERDGLELRERFLREGAALVRVKHPNVVTVYDAGIVHGMPFLAMELLEGQGLDRIIEREGRLSAARAISLLAPIAEGIASVHAAGLVHRDVKSENLFVTIDGSGREVVKLIDFGIAKEVSRTGVRNTVIGTPHYMPPEQLFGGDLQDGRADQYSLSVVLYEALTGTLPYDGNSVLDLAMNVERGGAPPPSLRNPTIPAELDSVVLRGLAREVVDRYPSMEAFHAALLEAVPFGTAPLGSHTGGIALPRDVSDEIERTRDFPTMVEPLAATLPPPGDGRESTMRIERTRDAELDAESDDADEEGRSGLVLSLAVGLVAVVAVVAGMSFARQKATAHPPAPTASAVVLPVLVPPAQQPPASAPRAVEVQAVPTPTATPETTSAPNESTPIHRGHRATAAGRSSDVPAPTSGPSIRLSR